MKRILLVFLIIFLIFGLVGCSSGESPEQAVKNALDALKVADIEKASKYINYDELTDETQSEDKAATVDSEEMLKLILKNLSYNVKSSSINGNSATVNAEIINTDMSKIIADFIHQAFAFIFSGLTEEQLDKKYLEIFTDLMNRNDNKTVTNTVEIQLSKTEDSWKINVSDELADAIFGGLHSAAENMNNSFGGDSELSKLREIDNWIVDDIWNKGFCDIRDYISNGTSSTGETLDIDFTLEQLDVAIAKKTEYDSFISGLDNTKYSQIKSIWSKLSSEIDILYNQIKQHKPVAKDKSNILDTGKFVQYRDAFSDAISNLD